MLLLLGCAAICIFGHAQTTSESSPTLPSAAPPAATSTSAPSGSQSASPVTQSAQSPASLPTADAGVQPPLPEIHALMREVETHQRAAEAAQQDYIYREKQLVEKLDGKGKVKKVTVSNEYNVFWLNGVEIDKLVIKNGHPLTARELKKEDKRIDKAVVTAKKRREKADANGVDTDSNGNLRPSLSELLSSAVFSNERRDQVNGRETILVDFAGDPSKKDRLDIMQHVAGTLGIDEKDRALVQANGAFISDLKILGGVVLKINKGMMFSMHHVKINDEAWLDQDFTFQGQMSLPIFLLFSGEARVEDHDSDYRKFKTESTILPGVSEVPDAPNVPHPTQSQP
jgi:hypothetical protein